MTLSNQEMVKKLNSFELIDSLQMEYEKIYFYRSFVVVKLQHGFIVYGKNSYCSWEGTEKSIKYECDSIIEQQRETAKRNERFNRFVKKYIMK